MNIDRADLDWAVETGIVQSEQATALWAALQDRHPIDAANEPPVRARFDMANLLYYFGALIVLGAMGMFMGVGWESFGGFGISLISMTYAAAFVAFGRSLWNKKMTVPGGLFITMAVGMMPLIVYGLQKSSGIWSNGDPGVYRDFHTWIDASWFYMELATIVAALVALKFFPFPFLTFPAAYALWYMSMDIAPLLTGHNTWESHESALISVVFGLAMMGIGFQVDQRTREDYAFWLYLFGMIAFWGGLIGLHGGDHWAGWCAINVGLMLLGPILDRRVFVVFGSIGVFSYIAYLSSDYLNSALFPFVLTAIGLGLIGFGIQYQRHHKEAEAAIVAMLPDALRRLLPRERVPRG